MNSDDIDYLKGFTVMGRTDAIAEAWNILKEEENGGKAHLDPKRPSGTTTSSVCASCATKDMIIRELESHISRIGRWIEQTGATHDVEPGLEFEENVASHDPRRTIYEPEKFNSDVAEGGQ